MLSKAQNYKPLAVFPGPNAPTVLRAYLRKSVMAFKKYEKAGSKGFEVRLHQAPPPPPRAPLPSSLLQTLAFASA